MTRGPPPANGFDAAIPVARARGRMMRLLSSPGNFGDFLIAGGGWLILARLRFSRRLHATLVEIAAEYRSAIDELRSVPAGGPVSLELWLYSRLLALRFFRLSGEGIVEIDRHGVPLATAKPDRTKQAELDLPVSRPVKPARKKRRKCADHGSQVKNPVAVDPADLPNQPLSLLGTDTFTIMTDKAP